VAFDFEFIALAIKLGTKLVTADKKPLRAFPRPAVLFAAR
jgi:predicted nucleic acid-binding protein